MEDVPPQPTGLEPLEKVWDPKLGDYAWRQAQPTHCQRDHPYVVGRESRVSISWVGCGCRNAVKAGGGGHDVYWCWTRVDGEECRDQRWQPECLDPNRRASGHWQG